LDEAVKRASVVVSGSVAGVEFLPGNGIGITRVHFRVDDVVKGNRAPGDELVVLFGGGPRLAINQDGSSKPVLDYFAVEPLLLQGDRAVLILEDAKRSGGEYEPQPWTGTNLLEQGRVKATEQNAIKTLFDGRSESELILLLKAAAARN
jgi:hypothetical protein